MALRCSEYSGIAKDIFLDQGQIFKNLVEVFIQTVSILTPFELLSIKFITVGTLLIIKNPTDRRQFARSTQSLSQDHATFMPDATKQ